MLIDRVFAGIYKGGAIFWELALNETADMAMDIAVMDPYVARFNRMGNDWELGQWQNGKWVSLGDDPTVMYVPFNAGPNEPFGQIADGIGTAGCDSDARCHERLPEGFGITRLGAFRFHRRYSETARFHACGGHW